MQFLKLWTKMVLRQWPKRVTLLLTAMVLIYLGMKYFDVANSQVPKPNLIAVRKYDDVKGGNNLVNIDDDIGTSMDTISMKQETGPVHNDLHVFDVQNCPVCFGDDLCKELESNFLKLDSEMESERPDRVLRYGTFKNENITIVTPAANEWAKFDEHICLNASETLPCDVSSAAWKGFLSSKATVESLENGSLMFGKYRGLNNSPQCSTPKYYHMLKKTFDDDGDGWISFEEQAHFIVSALLYPTYSVIKFHERIGGSLPIPRLLGVCGRSVIYAGKLTPLKNYLNHPFQFRAGLALQLIQMIDAFQDEESLWYFFFLDFTAEALAITAKGELVLTNLDDMLILDKQLFPPGRVLEIMKEAELCNEVCFQTFTRELLLSQNSSEVCPRIPYHGQLMYAVACKQVLSDLEEHHADGVFNFDGSRIHKKPEHKGLLHSVPERRREFVEDLLRECMQESSAGGRIQAIERLQDFLENHFQYDYGEDDGDHEPMKVNINLEKPNQIEVEDEDEDEMEDEMDESI